MPIIENAHQLASGASIRALLGAAAGTGLVLASDTSSSSTMSAFRLVLAPGLRGEGLAVPV